VAPTAGSEAWTLPWLRELATVLIAFGIVAVALVILAFTFFRIGEPQITATDVANAELLEAQTAARDEAFQNRLVVLNVSIGVLGVVTGYFFGRVPAERRAEKAEKAAEASSQAAETNAANAAAAHQAKTNAEQNAAAAADAKAAAEQEAADTKNLALASVRAAKELLEPAATQARTLSADIQPVPSGSLETALAHSKLEGLERHLSS
jgi:hypothetical protein